MTRIERICGEQTPPYVILFVTVVFTIVFFLRSPILMVSDSYFSEVYGVKREHYKTIELNIELFRRIKVVRVDQNADTETVVLAVQDAAKNPYCVIFPFRYANAAIRYSEITPNIKTIITGGYNKKPDNTQNVFFVSSDYKSDLERAGECAALLATLWHYKYEGADLSVKNIFLYTSNELSEQAVDIFNQTVQSIRSNINIMTYKSADTFRETPSVGVLYAPASSFITRVANQDVPLIVYSWLDPAFMPASVKITIDDSDLTQLSKIIKAIQNKANITSVDIVLPSTFKILPNRIKKGALLLQLRKVLTLKPQIPF